MRKSERGGSLAHTSARKKGVDVGEDGVRKRRGHEIFLTHE